jgi:hypothetical protein
MAITSKLAVLTLALSATFSAQATTLLFEDWTPVGGPLDVVTAPFGGTLVDSMVSNFSAGTSIPIYLDKHYPGQPPMFLGYLDGIATGTLRSAVFDTGAGLDYYYQVTSDQTSQGDLDTLLGSSFRGLGMLPVDMFQTSAAVGPFETGILAIDGVGRMGISNPDNMSEVLTNLIYTGLGMAPGTVSFTEIIRTTGIFKSIVGDFDVIGTGDRMRGTTTGYVPWMESDIATAVPEPETYAMLLAGLGLVGSMVRRRKGKQT